MDNNKHTIMKKALIFALAAAIVAVPSCKNNQKKAQAEAAEKAAREAAAAAELSSREKIVSEELKVDVANLIESAKKMKPVPFVVAQNDGRLSLTTKEKMVKPGYLLDPAIANSLVTLTQKYRVVAMLGTDLVIANLYEMPATPIKEAINKLLVDINDPAYTIFAGTPWGDLDNVAAAMNDVVDDEYAAGRPNFFWESMAAALVEQVYILTQNTEKFMPIFDDESVADVTFNFVCVHEGIKSMIEFYPEMASLNEILEPLYVINAINVEQFEQQLTSVKDDIIKARAFLLK